MNINGNLANKLFLDIFTFLSYNHITKLNQ